MISLSPPTICNSAVNSLLGLATKFSLTYKNHETLFEF
ncbi:hypothetical protein CSB68_4192 (plasmid) [Acinetobacter baumannii]|nr:hypothetical protein CSB68_4192 [Acinetobacter baumannii]